MAKDLRKLAEAYHNALNHVDFAALDILFATDAEYHSDATEGVYGKEAIIRAMRSYFAEFVNQSSTCERMDVESNRVRSRWRLSATRKSSGRPVSRRGTETLHFTPKGLIQIVEISDIERDD